MPNVKPIRYGVAIGLSLLFFAVAFKIERHQTLSLLSSYTLLFAVYLWILRKSTKDQFSFWIWAAVGLRVIVLFSVPNLSDDFYRFIWDGRLLVSGQHPFSHVPSYYMEHGISIPGLDESLYSRLNSKHYFTIYPPVIQFLFWISVKLSPGVYGSLMVFKSFILFSEVGSIILIRRIANRLNISHQNVLAYALNPLVILEFAGNAHFEAVMIFFVLLSLLFLIDSRQHWAAVSIGIAICIKLIPMIFLPAMLPLLGWKRATTFYLITFATILLLFVPLLNADIIIGFKNSLGYYFSRFEFNASIYYVVRWIGYLVVGYNIIHIAGGLLAAIATFLIFKVSLKSLKETNWVHREEKLLSKERVHDFLTAMMWSLLIYFLFTTTLHPWYVTTLVALAVFTPYKFVILWTFTIFFTYAGYSLNGFEENLWIVAFEYIVSLGYLAYELIWKRTATLSAA